MAVGRCHGNAAALRLRTPHPPLTVCEPAGVFKPPARALAVGSPGARCDWLSEPVPHRVPIGSEETVGAGARPALPSDWLVGLGGGERRGSAVS